MREHFGDVYVLAQRIDDDVLGLRTAAIYLRQIPLVDERAVAAEQNDDFSARITDVDDVVSIHVNAGRLDERGTVVPRPLGDIVGGTAGAVSVV